MADPAAGDDVGIAVVEQDRRRIGVVVEGAGIPAVAAQHDADAPGEMCAASSAAGSSAAAWACQPPRTCRRPGPEGTGQGRARTQPTRRHGRPRQRGDSGAGPSSARSRAGPMPSSEASAVAHASGGSSSVVTAEDTDHTARRSRRQRRLGAQRVGRGDVRGRDGRLVAAEIGQRQRHPPHPLHAPSAEPSGGDQPLEQVGGRAGQRRVRRRAPVATARRCSARRAPAPARGPAPPVRPPPRSTPPADRPTDRPDRDGSRVCAGRSGRRAGPTGDARSAPSTRRCTGSLPACRPRRTGTGSSRRPAGSAPGA